MLSVIKRNIPGVKSTAGGGPRDSSVPGAHAEVSLPVWPRGSSLLGLCGVTGSLVARGAVRGEVVSGFKGGSGVCTCTSCAASECRRPAQRTPGPSVCVIPAQSGTSSRFVIFLGWCICASVCQNQIVSVVCGGTFWHLCRCQFSLF